LYYNINVFKNEQTPAKFVLILHT